MLHKYITNYWIILHTRSLFNHITKLLKGYTKNISRHKKYTYYLLIVYWKSSCNENDNHHHHYHTIMIMIQLLCTCVSISCKYRGPDWPSHIFNRLSFLEYISWWRLRDEFLSVFIYWYLYVMGILWLRWLSYLLSSLVNQLRLLLLCNAVFLRERERDGLKIKYFLMVIITPLISLTHFFYYLSLLLSRLLSSSS